MKKNVRNIRFFLIGLRKLFENPRLTNLFVIILLTLIISFIILRGVHGFIPTLYSDNAIYAHLTWYFIQGQLDKAIHIWWQPLYPFFASILFVYFKDIPLALFYVSIIFGILLFIPIFLITYEATKNRLVSILAGLLATFHLQLIKSYYSLLTENLFITLLMFSVLFAVLTISRKKLVFALIYGFVVGLTYIARSDVLLSYQIFLGFGLLLVLSKQIPKSFYFKVLVYSILTFTVTISPYLYFNYQKFGYLNLGAKFNAVKNMPAYFSPQQNLTTTFAQDVWSLESPNYDSGFFNKPFPYWKYRIELWESSVERGRGYIRLFFEHENIIVIYMALAGFAVSAIYFLKFFKAGLLLNFLVVLGFLGSLPFQPGVDFRYSFWMYPIFSVFTCILLLSTNKLIFFSAQFFKKNLKFKLVLYAIIVLLNMVFVMFYFDVYKNNLARPPQTGDINSIHQVVGEQIQTLKPGARIMTRREAIPYFAKGSIVYIPSSINLEEFESYANLYDVDFVVADRDTFPPDTLLKTLNDVNLAPKWLKPVKVWVEGYPKTILYQVNRQ